MHSRHPPHLWVGGLAFIGIVLLSLNMRGAIVTVSPIAGVVAADIALSPVALTVIGMVPPIAFALSGLLTERLVRAVGLEIATVLALVLVVLGHVARGAAPGVAGLLLGTVVVMCAIGVGNVALPPLIRRYFPGNIPLVTSLSAGLFAIGTAIPAAVTFPLAQAIGWRAALGSWALGALIAVVPWALLARARSRRPPGGIATPRTSPPRHERVHRARTAWMLLAMYAVMGINLYAMYSWLPAIAVELIGMTPIEAGVALAVFSGMGLVMSLVIAGIAPRLDNPVLLVFAVTAAQAAGVLGLLVAPQAAPILWIALIGSFTPTLFQVTLMLIGLLTRTERGAVALSAFVQGWGFAAAAIGPLFFAFLQVAVGGWTVPLIGTVVLALFGALAASGIRRDRRLEDEWS